MARTYRDKERVKREKRWERELADFLGGGLLIRTSPEKLKRNNKYYEERPSTPTLWTNLTMTRPRRREARLFEHTVLLCKDLETCDPPMNWKRPHNYYW